METNRPWAGTPYSDRSGPGRARFWAAGLAIAALPLVLAVVGYFRPALRGEPVARMWLDVPFAAYQLSHASELGGRRRTIADDDRVGAPYQTEAAKNPSLYEGVDVMMLATAASRLLALSPAGHYHLAVLAALAANGWVAAWVVRRQTGSWLWAAVAVSLITLNYPTEWRITSGHNHILKYGWALLAVAAFSAYLRSPGWGRGVVLGLAVGLQLQGSFYQGFLLGLGLAFWWAGRAVAGRIGRAHLTGAVAAAGAFGLSAAAFTFPVWTVARSTILTDSFFQRTKKDVWGYGSELWQYVVPPDSVAAAKYVMEVGHKPMSLHFEGWAFPGYTVLLAVSAYLAARSRGWRPAVADPRTLDLWLGLGAVFVVLSLSGGPSFYVFEVFPTFRCYGRAGLLAMALGCVAAPVIAHALIGSLRRPGLRALATAAVVALAAFDGYQAVKKVPNGGPASPATAAWSAWLGRQPAGVKLAAFGLLSDRKYPYYSWGSDGFRERPGPGHAILNGAEFRLLEADLALLGASYERINPAALRFVVSLGYDALAFDKAYLDRNPWLRHEPGLALAEARDGWSVYRAGPELRRFRTTTPGRLLAAQPAKPAPTAVPPNSWVTGGFDLADDVVVAGDGRVFLAWTDASGHISGRPRRALFQHVFGKDIPAYHVLTPARPGNYRLSFLDPRGRVLAEKPYVVSGSLKKLGNFSTPGDVAGVSIRPLDGDKAGGRVRVAVENRSPFFLQAAANRWFVCPSARPVPGFGGSPSGSLTLRLNDAPGGPGGDTMILLPRDLPPGGRIELDLTSDLFNSPPGDVLAALTPLIRSENGTNAPPLPPQAVIGARSPAGGKITR